MGTSPDDGAVVDQYGRVHGVSALRVFDASIMPVIPRANTNVSVIAMGERAAELLRAGT
jgi:choline dehydrogenase-like flavoprotein